MSHNLPPHLERIGAELATAAAHRGAQVPRRLTSRRRLVLVAATVTLAATGTAMAITGTNPLDWFRGGDPSREGRFTGDPSRRVVAEFPSQIACQGDDGDLTCRATAPPLTCRETPQPDGTTSETCTSGSQRCRESSRPDGSVVTECSGRGAPTIPRRPGERRYSLFGRVEERPSVDLAFVQRMLSGREDEVVFPPGTPAPYAGLTVRDVLQRAERMTPEFWRAVNLVIANQGGRISSGGGTPGKELVPPRNRSRFATCGPPTQKGLRCAAIVNGAALPIGAPIYSLEPDADWVLVPFPSQAEQSAEYIAIWRAMLGRDLTEEESVVLLGMFALPYKTASAPVAPSPTTPAPAPRRSDGGAAADSTTPRGSGAEP